MSLPAVASMQLAKRTTEPSEKLVGVTPDPSLPAAPGVEQMFVEIYQRVAPKALRHARRFLNRDDARDALSAALFKAWKQWKHLTPEQMTDAYLYRAIHNEIITIYRANKGLVGLDEAEAELTQLAIHKIDAVSRATTAQDIVDLVIASMPRRRREVFLLVQHFHFTYKEAAEMLGLGYESVKTHVKLANDDIREAFRGRGFRLDAGGQLRLPAGSREASNG